MKGDKYTRWSIDVMPDIDADGRRLSSRWRSELWYRPFSGRIVAATSWVTTKGQATKDGKKYLRLPEATR